MGGYVTNKLAMCGKIFENNSIKPSDYLPHFYRILKEKTHCYIMRYNLNLQEMLNEATKVGFHFVKCLIWDKQSKIFNSTLTSINWSIVFFFFFFAIKF